MLPYHSGTASDFCFHFLSVQFVLNPATETFCLCSCQKDREPTEQSEGLLSAPGWRSKLNPVGRHEKESNFSWYHNETVSLYFEVLQASLLKYHIFISII